MRLAFSFCSWAVFALEPVRRPSARSFSEEGEILSESLVRTLTGLNRDLEGLLRATAAMRPYFGENTKDGKFPHLLIQLNKALDVQCGAQSKCERLSPRFATGISNQAFFRPNCSCTRFEGLGFLRTVHLSQ